MTGIATVVADALFIVFMVFMLERAKFPAAPAVLRVQDQPCESHYIFSWIPGSFGMRIPPARKCTRSHRARTPPLRMDPASRPSLKRSPRRIMVIVLTQSNNDRFGTSSSVTGRPRASIQSIQPQGWMRPTRPSRFPIAPVSSSDNSLSESSTFRSPANRRCQRASKSSINPLLSESGGNVANGYFCDPSDDDDRRPYYEFVTGAAVQRRGVR